MKIDKKDFDKLLEKVNLPIEKKRITDLNKYMYWHNKSDYHINKMVENKRDKTKFFNHLHESLLCETEKNKYCILSKKEKIVLYLMLKYHNSNNEDKIYMDKNGLKVNLYDRRAIRDISTAGI